MRMGRIQSLGLAPRPRLSCIYSAKDMFNPLVSMLPKFALQTANYFIISLLEMLFTHKLALLLVICQCSQQPFTFDCLTGCATVQLGLLCETSLSQCSYSVSQINALIVSQSLISVRNFKQSSLSSQTHFCRSESNLDVANVEVDSVIATDKPDLQHLQFTELINIYMDIAYNAPSE